MAQGNQYLRIGIGTSTFLLPSAASLAIEQRETLVLENGAGAVSAWRDVKGDRWPAYCLDEQLEPARRQDWHRAVFVAGVPTPLGLLADEVQLLTQVELHVEPFTPVGPPPTPAGHVFAEAAVEGTQATLVFSPTGLAAYLQRLGA